MLRISMMTVMIAALTLSAIPLASASEALNDTRDRLDICVDENGGCHGYWASIRGTVGDIVICVNSGVGCYD